ncbi:DHA2 family efflux MFS transporter permease subunit [Streptomyces profundus]|uniref:DHA2 family efflux MFS transporter permease subunit n=1 Tax=Streptomyces profundus TaxID=2867410 RepID=UPI001D16283B|nr:DHA2 family efflux MFS transporter permease subunit [Streptomyces sp. MA3_2.13]UED84189.1 DHA2 family efflux MFS transporter permease subunit [Streptomyces sp. MA3_2.13]
MSSLSPDGDRLDPRLLALIGVVLLGGLLGILNSTMAAVATDTLAVSFDTSLSTAGWTSTGFLLAVTATIPFTTWAVDRYGGKRLWLIGLGLFVTGSLASGLAWNVGSLIAFRTFQGIGAGVLDPLVLILLARAAGPRRAGRVMGLMGVVLALGPALGPVSGGAVLEVFSWRWMFLLSVPLGLVALLLAHRALPADPPAGERRGHVRLDVLGLALLAPGFAALVLALSQTAEQGGLSAWQALLPLLLGATLMLGYTTHALRTSAAHPLIDLRLFGSRGFTASVTIMGLSGLINFAAFFALPLYFQQAHGHGVLAAGLLMAPVGIGGSLSMPIAGRLSDRVGSRQLATGGTLLAALCTLGFTRVDAGTHELQLSATALLLGVALGFLAAPTMGSPYRTLPEHQVAQGSSVLYMLNQLGAALGVAVVTLIFQTSNGVLDGFRHTFWFTTATFLVILLTIPLLPGPPTTPSTGRETARVGAG